MATRTFHCALRATITVDDATVKSAMLGFGLREGPDGPPIEDQEIVFNMQQQMLGAVEVMPPAQLMQAFLMNGYFVPLAVPVKNALEARLPGARVQLEGIDVTTD